MRYARGAAGSQGEGIRLRAGCCFLRGLRSLIGFCCFPLLISTQTFLGAQPALPFAVKVAGILGVPLGQADLRGPLADVIGKLREAAKQKPDDPHKPIEALMKQFSAGANRDALETLVNAFNRGCNLDALLREMRSVVHVESTEGARHPPPSFRYGGFEEHDALFDLLWMTAEKEHEVSPEKAASYARAGIIFCACCELDGVFGHASDVCTGNNKKFNKMMAAELAALGKQRPEMKEMSANELIPMTPKQQAELISLYKSQWQNQRIYGDKRLVGVLAALDRLIDAPRPAQEEWQDAFRKLEARWPVDEGDVAYEHKVVKAAWELRNLAVSLEDREATKKVGDILKAWRDGTSEPHLKRWCSEALERIGTKPRRTFPQGFDEENPDEWYNKYIMGLRK